MTQRTKEQLRGRRISYDELRAHSTYDDAWISINSVVYDITNFIPEHPFGDTFRGHLGTECGGLFASAHLTTNVDKLILNDAFLTKNKIFVVGRLDMSNDHMRAGNDDRLLDRIVYMSANEDKFWADLKTAVGSFLKTRKERTHYTNGEAALRLFYHVAVYALFSYLTWIEGSYIAAGLLGFIMVCTLANIAHMATHAGFATNKWLDFLAMSLYDLSGTSGLEWQIAHQTHHHQPHSSIDYQTNGYNRMGVRIHKYMGYSRRHKYQPIYFWIVISTYLPFKLVATTLWLHANRRFVKEKHEIAVHVLARIILLSEALFCAYLNGVWNALIIFSIYSIVYSQTAFILLFNNHEETHWLLGETEDVKNFHHKMSWAEAQVRTSGNWYPTNPLLSFVEFHYGYFNYHIEHHLFPTLKPSLLKKIAPFVRQVCDKHNVPYISTSFLEVQKSLWAHICKLSLPER